MAGGRSVLVAGVGNVLKGDDGFGVAVAQRLMRRSDLPAGVVVIETGIGGMSLVQELMRGYDALAIVDAYSDGGSPGQLYELEPILPDLTEMSVHERRDYFSDTHYATPLRALGLAEQVGALPGVVRLFGCEPSRLNELHVGLSPAVEAAVDRAVERIAAWISRSPSGAAARKAT